MVEEEVEPGIFAACFEWDLAADEREAYAEFDEELAQMGDEFTFKVALPRFVREGQEIEIVGGL